MKLGVRLPEVPKVQDSKYLKLTVQGNRECG